MARGVVGGEKQNKKLIPSKNVLLIIERVEKVFLFSTYSKAKIILPSSMYERVRNVADMYEYDSGKF